MPRLILLIAIALIVYLMVRRVQNLPPHKRRAGYVQLLLVGAAAIAIVLTLAGKMHWIGAAATGLLVVLRQSLPVLLRAFPLLQGWLQTRQNAGTSQHSEVRSAVLCMTLDHSSGELNGEVIGGPYKDWLLSEMSEQQLNELLDYCRSQDEDSVQLLTSYLEQRFPNGFGGGDTDTASGDSDTMTRSEALAVLGLDENASDEDISAAHKRLMQKLHPDRGGNDYLAAKINAAKDFLLHS